MAVYRLEFTNQNDESRFLLRFQSTPSNYGNGWKNNLNDAFEEAGIDDELSDLSGFLPDSDKITPSEWGSVYLLMNEFNMAQYITTPGSAGGGDYTLRVNTEYKYSNGRYFKITTNQEQDAFRFEVYDTDDSVIYTGEYFNPSRLMMYGCIPSKVRASDTFADFRAGTAYVSMLMYVTGSDPYEPSSFSISVVGPSSSTPLTDWIYYLIHDPNNDVDIPENPEPPSPDDPYDPYDPSGPTPPGPDDPDDPYDPGDPIEPPASPGWDPSDSGFLKIFIPSRTTLGLLSSKLWDDNFFTTMLKDFIADPRDAIISLGCVPFNVTPAGTAEIKVGIIGTGISSAYVDSPYIDIDCGGVDIKPVLNGYTDYSPFTDMYLYLPYIGSVQLDTDIYMNKTLNITYRCDILTGDCIAFLKVNNSIKATYNGNLRFGVPLTSADYTQMWNTFLSVTTGALLGAAGAAAAGAEAGAVDVATGALKGGTGKLSQSAGIKPQIQISGQVQSTNGLLGVQKPYVEIRRPNLCIPEGQKVIEGYPSLMSATLSSLSGYTEVEEIHLSIPGATEQELVEIETLLKEGVIL